MPKLKKNIHINYLKCGCPKVWMRVSKEDAEKLEIPTIKICENKHFMPPFFVHDSNGDYYAPKTICKDECDGKFIYFCTKCRSRGEA